jgi:glycerol-3-phosphate O-acyltransferase/dihydroxyacetone phosphate acyltransferase
MDRRGGDPDLLPAPHHRRAGAAIYVANHPNGLLDPLVLRVTIGRAVRFLAKSTLWANPFGRLAMDAFACLPVYRQQDVSVNERGETVARNEETFARCRAELAAGADLALYPEGTSHSDPQLKPLKTGAARIALGAAAEASATATAKLPVLVPIGSHYENPALFRSAVHLVVGAPIELGPYLPGFAADPRRAIDALTNDIRARLDGLILQAETRELLAGIARVASWTAAVPDDDAPERHHSRTRELLAAYARLRESDPARVERLTEAARAYASLLEKMGVRDPWALETPRVSLGRIARATARILLMTPVAAWGVVTSWVPYRVTGFAARKATKDDDVLSTLKMIGGAAFLVAAWLIEAVVIGVRFGAGAGVGSLVVAPLAGYAALRFSENLREVVGALRHLGWRARGETVRRLTERRLRLAADVAEALRQVGGS